MEGDKQIMTVCPCMEEKQGQLIEKVPNELGLQAQVLALEKNRKTFLRWDGKEER